MTETETMRPETIRPETGRPETGRRETMRDWSTLQTVAPAYKLVQERGLAKNLEELEAFGLTVILPEQLGEPDLLRRAREAILRIA